jgi:hypothetical protein
VLNQSGIMPWRRMGEWRYSLTPRNHWIGGWVGCRVGLDPTERKQILAPAVNRFPIIQLVASRYTDWAVPAAHRAAITG